MPAAVWRLYGNVHERARIDARIRADNLRLAQAVRPQGKRSKETGFGGDDDESGRTVVTLPAGPPRTTPRRL